MMALARSLERNYWTVSLALVLALGVLLVLSPAEATLGSVVKIVYLHGAMERISSYAYLVAAASGLALVVVRQSTLVRWTLALTETAIAFWLGQIIISLPAQLLAWGGLMWDEPRVVGAFWILVLTALVYVVARWIAEPAWLALAAVANGVIVLVVLRGGIDLLHPVNPIMASESVSIKLFYFAIVVVMGVLALLLAHYRATAGRACGANNVGEQTLAGPVAGTSVGITAKDPEQRSLSLQTRSRGSAVRYEYDKRE